MTKNLKEAWKEKWGWSRPQSDSDWRDEIADWWLTKFAQEREKWDEEVKENPLYITSKDGVLNLAMMLQVARQEERAKVVEEIREKVEKMKFAVTDDEQTFEKEDKNAAFNQVLSSLSDLQVKE